MALFIFSCFLLALSVARYRPTDSISTGSSRAALLDGKVDWVVSDHACCKAEIKTDQENPDEIFLAKTDFGGTEYLLCGLIT